MYQLPNADHLARVLSDCGWYRGDDGNWYGDDENVAALADCGVVVEVEECERMVG